MCKSKQGERVIMNIDQDLEYYQGFLQNLDPNDPYYEFRRAVIEEDLNRVISEHDQMLLNQRRYEDENQRHSEIEREQIYFENLYYGG